MFTFLYNFLNNLVDSYPFFGVIFSIILLLGFYGIGEFFFKFKLFKNIFINISELKYLKIFFGVNIFLLISYILVVYQFYTKFIISLFSVSIFIIGILIVFLKFNKIQNIKYFTKNLITNNENEFRFDQIIFVLFIIGYFFLSLAPVTQSDALGYHMFVGKNIIENGHIPFSLIYLHSFLSGSGEILIALGLFFGSEQFGGLIQFSGLLGLLGVCKKFAKKDYFVLLLLISSPVLIFLGSSPKPQLFFACTNAVVLSLYLYGKDNLNLGSKYLFIKYLITISFLISSINGKFSFLLSSSLIIFLILIDSIKLKKMHVFIFSLFISISIFYLPIISWKYFNFGGNFVNYIFSPFPIHFSFFENFNNYLINYQRGYGYLSVFIPKSLGQITYSLGFSVIYIFFIFKKEISEKYILLSLITAFVIIIIFKGQFNARFFIEPYFWLIILLSKYGIHKKNLKFINLISYLQIFCILIITWYGVLSLSKGSLSKNLRNDVMASSANGYLLFNWANNILKEDDKVLSIHRSVSLANFNVIPGDFISWLTFKNNYEKELVRKLILKEKPKLILYTSGDEILFKNCLGDILHKGNKISNYATRNPFNKNLKFNDVYIQNFNYRNFPECLEKKKKNKD